jgi:hypothetical protein
MNEHKTMQWQKVLYFALLAAVQGLISALGFKLSVRDFTASIGLTDSYGNAPDVWYNELLVMKELVISAFLIGMIFTFIGAIVVGLITKPLSSTRQLLGLTIYFTVVTLLGLCYWGFEFYSNSPYPMEYAVNIVFFQPTFNILRTSLGVISALIFIRN